MIGVPVPWYRVNGWIAQSGGESGGFHWSRYRLCLLGVALARTPWFIIGDSSTGKERDK